MINKILKSVIDQDRMPVVICNLEHEVIYMNEAADRFYANRGGHKIMGQNLMRCHSPLSCEKILKVLEWFKADKNNNMIYTAREEEDNKDIYMVALRDEQGELIGYYEKHEVRDAEKANLYDFTKSLI